MSRDYSYGTSSGDPDPDGPSAPPARSEPPGPDREPSGPDPYAESEADDLLAADWGPSGPGGAPEGWGAPASPAGLGSAPGASWAAPHGAPGVPSQAGAVTGAPMHGGVPPGVPLVVVPAAPSVSVLAVVGFALGAGSVVTCSFIVGIVGFVLSLIGYREVSRGTATGRGMAIAGMSLSAALVVLKGLVIALYLLLVVGLAIVAPETA